jgi:hypothetical protein
MRSVAGRWLVVAALLLVAGCAGWREHGYGAVDLPVPGTDHDHH